MCRPIESRDSLGAMGSATSVLFASHPSAYNNNHTVLANQKVKNATGRAPIWSTANDMSFGVDGINMLNMTAPPLVLPFVTSSKNNTASTIPWDTAAPMDDLLSLGLPSNQFPASPIPLESKPKKIQMNFEAQELEELLECSMPGDSVKSSKENTGHVNVNDGFDGTEMSILYSFLVDTPKVTFKKVDEVDDGVLNLNMMTASPVERLVESLEADFTDPEVMMIPRCQKSKVASKVLKCPGEVKNRRLCKSEGCYKRSRSNGLCISHGGGRRCAMEGCDKSSQGGNLCIRHGGGKRCSYNGCDKAAQSNFLCKAHGGGPRCQFNDCSRSSQGGGFCRSHGGGKRCMYDGCEKGTQRGDFCALHGGSRLCEAPGCMRNDRGGGLCATHGGGKRCTVDACNRPCRRKGLCSAHLRQAEDATE
ncbi:unnamed protein product [Peronospora belbahrii]|uniref:WRKY19-like zinc finger domain-containing protein n=1 Tax=Peronospora belbahrii TaxID=622444 RepID=A0ABN8D6L7_9STRA|nr:unnamed protein product [Peronospora belbahrii]